VDDPVRVLHVDDDAAFVETAAALLEREDDRIQVTTETRPADALDRLDGGVDCLVADYDMPEMDGLELLDRARERDPDLPVVLFTGEGSETVASDAISAGVTDYLQKGGGPEQYTILANRVVNAAEARHARERLERRAEAMDTASEGIAILDEDGCYVAANEAYAAIHGVDRADLLGAHWHRTVPEEEAAVLDREVIPTLADGSWSGVVEGERADGSRYEKRLSLAALPDGGHVCTARDVTDEADRRRRLRDHRRVVETAPDAIAILDADGRFQFVNDALVDLTGHDEADLLGSHCGLIKPDDAMDETRAALDRAFAEDRPVRVESALRTADGDRVVCEDHLAPLPGRERRAVAVHRDVTDRVTRERELERQNERLDEFVGVVSHDLRSPLEVARGRLDLAPDGDHVDAAQRALGRMERLVDDLLDLARTGERVGDAERCDLGDVARSSWATVDTGDATLDVTATGAVRADPGRLRQLFENLFRNAVEHGDATTVRVVDLPDGFAVADDGTGIPEDERESAFEAGYSTAPDGTGFGLAIVERTADAHGWVVAAAESERGGARVEVTGVDRY
jgi:PAS domain S-box-containing protein